MIAVQGLYEDGRIQLQDEAPVKKASVIVIFPEERLVGKRENEIHYRELFDDFSGSISRTIDEKVELMVARDEKYAHVD